MAEGIMERRLTVQGALDAATETLAKAGIEGPRRDATRLLGDLLDLTPAEVMLERGSVIEPDRRRWINRAVERRAAGEPLAYVTGITGFRTLVLRSDPRALIPRPETEGIVDRALALAAGGVALDVGTGTGCLALSLRAEGRYQRVFAVDIDRKALGLADHNRRHLGLEIDLVLGDLGTAVASGSVDLVVSNPPYVSESEYAQLGPEVRDFEPRLALASGVDGLDASRRLLHDGLRVLRPGGWMIMEVASARGEALHGLAYALGWRDLRVDEDLFGRPRYLVARREVGT
ncbi:MAG: peptide chain release factor N(5)-glutamine methyltransferase [Gemmatimonadetes bacterium]|nr:peptide chain release factor N(5)-glutamine methyltransferase [Gemmatimonadota bacterium]